jgi:hypothetical protein
MGRIRIFDAVLYLKSTPFVTGEIILHVDGGQSASH